MNPAKKVLEATFLAGFFCMKESSIFLSYKGYGGRISTLNLKGVLS